uniref:Uncharacterized protein n=1 Tax=Anguilla anguilla TaxID=7936 RepID=A0A0E9R3Y4_ANGAN
MKWDGGTARTCADSERTTRFQCGCCENALEFKSPRVEK